MRKLDTNKTQSLHKFRIRKKLTPKSTPENNYQAVQWQIDDKITIPQDDLYTLAWEVEIGGHLFDFPIIYTDPNPSDFDKSHTQGPDTAIVPRCYFHESSDGQNRETCPASDPSIVHPSNLNRMVKIRTFIPLQTYVIMIVPNKHLNEIWTLKQNTSLYSIHH